MLAGLLHLSNVSFEPPDGSDAGATADGSQLAGAAAEATLAVVRQLWGLPEHTAVAMTKRRVESKRGSVCNGRGAQTHVSCGCLTPELRRRTHVSYGCFTPELRRCTHVSYGCLTRKHPIRRSHVEAPSRWPDSVGLKPEQAALARDSLAKHVYSALFLWITQRVNDALQSPQALGLPAAEGAAPANGISGVAAAAAAEAEAEVKWVGLLDAFGFELLGSNSLEQLLINATNEALQHFFLECVYTAEQARCEAERIP